MAITEMEFPRRDFLTLGLSRRRSRGGQPPRKPRETHSAQPEPHKLGLNINRRLFITVGATVMVAGGVAALVSNPWEWFSNQPPDSPQTPTPEQPLNPTEQLNRVHQEVRHLALMYPEDSLVRKVYLGNLAEINPIFPSPLPVGFIDPAPYARTYFGKAEYTSVKRFRYFLARDGSIADYATLQKQAVSISFSDKWLSSTNDRVKSLALEKEALQISLWEPFSRIVLNTYLSQGRVEKLDPTVTEQEIAHTFTRNLLIENADVRKLYDYAGYIAVLPKVGQLLMEGNPQVIAEANYSNLPSIYELARKRNVVFDGLAFASTDFLRMAFDPNSPWVAIILDPTIPVPPPPSS